LAGDGIEAGTRKVQDQNGGYENDPKGAVRGIHVLARNGIGFKTTGGNDEGIPQVRVRVRVRVRV